MLIRRFLSLRYATPQLPLLRLRAMLPLESSATPLRYALLLICRCCLAYDTLMPAPTLMLPRLRA